MLKEAIAHHELLGGATDVAIVVHNAHASESSDVNLESNVLSHIHINVSLLCWVSTHCLGSAEVIETLVSDFINHINYYNIISCL